MLHKEGRGLKAGPGFFCDGNLNGGLKQNQRGSGQCREPREDAVLVVKAFTFQHWKGPQEARPEKGGTRLTSAGEGPLEDGLCLGVWGGPATGEGCGLRFQLTPETNTSNIIRLLNASIITLAETHATKYFRLTAGAVGTRLQSNRVRNTWDTPKIAITSGPQMVKQRGTKSTMELGRPQKIRKGPEENFKGS